MTNEEAKRSILTYCVEECGMIESCDLVVGNNCVEALAIKALEAADKYCWHDLRKDPEDLPKLGEMVESVCLIDGKTYYCIDNPLDEGSLKGIKNGISGIECIAWKYDIPFSEDKE